MHEACGRPSGHRCCRRHGCRRCPPGDGLLPRQLIVAHCLPSAAMQGQVVKAVVVETKKEVQRKDGRWVLPPMPLLLSWGRGRAQEQHELLQAML